MSSLFIFVVARYRALQSVWGRSNWYYWTVLDGFESSPNRRFWFNSKSKNSIVFAWSFTDWNNMVVIQLFAIYFSLWDSDNVLMFIKAEKYLHLPWVLYLCQIRQTKLFPDRGQFLLIQRYLTQCLSIHMVNIIWFYLYKRQIPYSECVTYILFSMRFRHMILSFSYWLYDMEPYLYYWKPVSSTIK